jgi:hypothetical protein
VTEPTGGSNDDIEQLKERILLRAKALANSPEFARCPAVMGLICDAMAFGVRVEAEIFQAVYGDPSGREYWDAQLSEPMSVFSLARLLAVHKAENAQQLEYAEIAALRAFRDAAQAGETLFLGETAPLLAIGDGYGPFDGLSDVKVLPRAAVEWLLAKPKREHLVPDSLRRCLRPVGSSALVDPSAPVKPRVRGGPKPRADWDAVKIALQLRIEEIGRPAPYHDDKNWRSRADVVRWVDHLLIERGEHVAASTIGERVDKMFPNLVDRQTELDGNRSPSSSV